MDGGAPRLPRLGGHRSGAAAAASTRDADSSTSPFSPIAPAQASRLQPANASRSPDRATRLNIDVGYDDDGIPHASRRSSNSSLSLSTSGATPSTPPHPSPRAQQPGATASAPAPAHAAAAWRSQVKEGVLRGVAHRQASPEAVAAVPREEVYAALEEEEESGAGFDADFADDDATPARAGGRCPGYGALQPQQRYPVMVPGGGQQPARTGPRPIPEVSTLSTAITVAVSVASPGSPTSSIITDTPRSILRQSGTATRQPPRTGRRRSISFVGVSPPGSEERCNGPPRIVGGDDSSGDEYESAEPSLYYDSETPPASAGATPPQHARSRCEGSEDTRRGASPSPPTPPDPRPTHAGVKRPLQLSPEQSQRSGRSLTRSPPRNGFVALEASPERYSAPAAAVPVGTAASAPPPPEEEEGDEVTLDVAPAQRQQQRQHQVRARSPTRPLSQAWPQRQGSLERDEDVLTQPHNHSERGTSRRDAPGAGAAASVVRRLPMRQRWPADPYLDDPPTEASDARRTRQEQRERLDPEDDMGSAGSSSGSSATGRSNSDDSDSDTSATLLRYNSPVKPSTRDSPPRATSPPEELPSPSEQLPERHLVEQQTHHRDQRHRGGDERADSQLPAVNAKSAEAADGTPRSRSRDSSSSHGSPKRSGRETRAAPAEEDGPINEVRATTATAAAAPPLGTGANCSPSPGQSPSSITERSSGQSVAEDVSQAAQGTRRTPTPTPTPLNHHHEHDHDHDHGHHHGSSSPSSGSREEAGDAYRGASLIVAVHASGEKMAKKPASPSRAAEPQVYVDPLLRERRLLHERARDASPPYVERPQAARPVTSGHRSPSREHNEGIESQQSRLPVRSLHVNRHRYRRNSTDSANGAATTAAAVATAAGGRQSAVMPMSLRDVMERHESPAALPHRRSAAGSNHAILRRPDSVRQLKGPHETPASHSEDEDIRQERLEAAAAERRKGTSTGPTSPAASSTRSSGGVPADALVWDEAAASPPLSPRSPPSAAVAATTPGAGKVLRKKLVVVVRSHSSGKAPSEDDPVVQMSMLPFKQGAAALLSSERRHSDSSDGRASAPVLEKLIDHVESKRRDSVSSRWRDGACAEDQDGASEGGRLRFRRALSGLSSRSVSPRESVPPSAARPSSTQRRRSSLPASGGARSTDERGALQKAAEVRQRHPSRSPESLDRREARPAGQLKAPSTSTSSLPHAAAGTVTVTSAAGKEVQSRASQPHLRNESPDPSATASQAIARRRRHHHHHHSHRSGRSVGTQSVVEPQQQQQQRTAAAAPPPVPALPNAPYRETQNEEFYGATEDMAADVAALQERIGITPVTAPMLPRLALQADVGLVVSHHARNPRGNVDAGHSQAEGAWSGASSENGDAAFVARVPAAQLAQRSASSRHLQTLQYTSGTQTEHAAGAAFVAGSTRAGMPLYAATPVQHVPVLGPASAALVPSVTERVLNTLGDVDAGAVEARLLAGAGNGVDREGAEESPASFVKRPASPVTAVPSSAAASPASRLGPDRSLAALPSTRPDAGAVYGSAAGGASAPAPYVPFVASAASSLPPALVAGGFHPPAISGGGGPSPVPLFVPPLTVDNVSHLSQEWQSTLRERSSKAKQDAMEQFLIASAEAGAAEAAAAAQVRAAVSAAAPRALVPSGPHAAPRFAAQGALPVSEWAAQRGWPAQPLQEFYGNAAAAAQPSAIASVPLSIYSAIPHSFSVIEHSAQHDAATSARRLSLSSAPAGPQALPTAIAVPQLSSDRSLADGFAVASPRGNAASTSTKQKQKPQPRRARASESVIDGESAVDEVDALPPAPSSALGKHARDHQQQQRPTTEKAANSRQPAAMSPPVFAIVESAPDTCSTHAHTKKGDRRGRRKDRPDDEKAETDNVSDTATSSSSSSVSRRARSRKSKKDAKHAESKSTRRRKLAKKSRSGRQDDHEHRRSHRRRSGDISSSSSSSGDVSDRKSKQLSNAHRSPAALALDVDDGNDNNSDLATSVEFQLSRLQRMREATAFLIPPASASEVAVSERHKHHTRRDAASKSRKKKRSKAKEDEENDDDDDKEGNAEQKHGYQRQRKHRSRSSRSRSRSRSPKEKSKKHSKKSGKHRSASAKSTKAGEADAAGHKSRKSVTHKGDDADKAERHRRHRKDSHRSRSTTPPQPGPLPPPPPTYGADNHRYPHRSAKDNNDDVGRESYFASPTANAAAASRSRRSASLYSPRDDAATFPRSIFEDRTHPSRTRYSSAHPSFRSDSVFSGSRAEESRWARSRSAADARGESPTDAYRYRRPSSTFALGGRGRSPLGRYQRSGGVGGRDGGDDNAASPASRWASAARRPSTPASTYKSERDQATPWQQRSFSATHSTARRPSTRWDDYVREAERGDGGGKPERPQQPYGRRSSPTDPPTSSYTPAAPSLAEQRRRTAEGRTHDSTTREPPRRQTSLRPYTASYASPRPRRSADTFHDIDSIPQRQYFNDDVPTSRTATTTGAAHQGAPSDLPSSTQPSKSSYTYQRRGVRDGGPSAASTTAAASRPRHRLNADDLLVSTPPGEGVSADSWTPDEAADGSVPRSAAYGRAAAGRPPPPPPPPPPTPPSPPPHTAVSSTSAAAAATMRWGAQPNGCAALPIAAERVVTDAQAADDFVGGVTHIIDALKRYTASVA